MSLIIPNEETGCREIVEYVIKSYLNSIRITSIVDSVEACLVINRGDPL